ncbi:hypothetical protein GCM10027446_02900 [Angustibacter peucedani]
MHRTVTRPPSTCTERSTAPCVDGGGALVVRDDVGRWVEGRGAVGPDVVDGLGRPAGEVEVPPVGRLLGRLVDPGPDVGPIVVAGADVGLVTGCGVPVMAPVRGTAPPGSASTARPARSIASHASTETSTTTVVQSATAPAIPLRLMRRA